MRKLQGGKFFTSSGKPNGFVLEVSTPQESYGFEVFKERIRQVSKVDLSQFEEENCIKYQTIYGDEIEFSYSTLTGEVERKLNGASIQTENFPLYSSPFLKHYPNEKRLVLRINNQWLEFDFEKWKMLENVTSISEQLQGDFE